MADANLDEVQIDTVEHITDENMDTAANAVDPSKPHDASIPEPERDSTNPDDPTMQHESAHHPKHHAAGMDASAQAGTVPPQHGPANDQGPDHMKDAGNGSHEHMKAGAKAGEKQAERDEERDAGNGAGGQKDGRTNQQGAGNEQASAGGEGKSSKGPRLDPKQQAEADKYLEQMLATTDWAWQNKTGKAREVGHQSFIHMEKAFMLSAYGDPKGASDRYQKYAGKPPSEALLKRASEMSPTNVNASLKDLNHGIHKIGLKQTHVEIGEHMAGQEKVRDDWEKGMKEHAREQDGHTKNATGQIIKDYSHPQHEKEHGQFILKGLWKSFHGGTDARKAVVSKWKKNKATAAYREAKRNVGALAKAERAYALKIAGTNPENSTRKGAQFETKARETANDNEQAKPAEAAATKGMSGRAMSKFQGAVRGVYNAQAKALQETGRVVKGAAQSVRNGVGRVFGAEAPEPAQAQQTQTGPNAQTGPARGPAANEPKFDMSAARGAPGNDQAKPAANATDGLSAAQRAQRSAAQAGMGRGG